MSGMAKVSIGLKKTVPSKTSDPSSNKNVNMRSVDAAFGDQDDDDFTVGLRREKSTKDSIVTKQKIGLHTDAAPLSRAARERRDIALKMDSSIYDYDGVYDSMKGSERSKTEKKEQDKQKRDPKYMVASLATAEQRKVDRQRAEAKKIQREREKEGDEFADTESFVTDAYKKQMEEMREAEEREKQREEQDRLKSRGVAGFYKDLLADQDRAHQQAVAASLNPHASSNMVEDSSNQDDSTLESQHSKRIQQAREKGLDVRLNDDNEVVDERSLLSAGLNTFKKRSKPINAEQDDRPLVRPRVTEDTREQTPHQLRQAQRERQSKLIEDQMLAIQQQKQQEEKEQERQKREALTGSKERRNDRDKIAAARQRALERRKAQNPSA